MLKLIFKLLQQVNKKNQTNKNINKTMLCLTILNIFDNQLKIEKVISHKLWWVNLTDYIFYVKYVFFFFFFSFRRNIAR